MHDKRWNVIRGSICATDFASGINQLRVCQVQVNITMLLVMSMTLNMNMRERNVILFHENLPWKITVKSIFFYGCLDANLLLTAICVRIG